MSSPRPEPPVVSENNVQIDEAALIARWRAGDRAAAVPLLHRQVEPLCRYFSRRVPCRADVEDLVQRTLLASIDALPRYREHAGFSCFVRGIASKLLLHHHRDGQRARARAGAGVHPEGLRAGQPSALAWVCREDGFHRLHRAFDALPDASARLLHLRYWEERDTSEIGRLLDLSPGAVRTRLHRARHEMRRALVDAAASGSGVWPLAEP
jgi:RNA polymerase sigma-70 factor (ECF subfamily)